LGCIFASKARINNRKEIVRQQQYANFGPLTAEIGSGVWGTPQISTGFASWLRYCTGGQPNFPWSLAVSWAGTLYRHFGALALWRNFARCKIHFTSKSCAYIRSVTARHSIAAGVSQTLRRGTRNGILELSLTAPSTLWVKKTRHYNIVHNFAKCW